MQKSLQLHRKHMITLCMFIHVSRCMMSCAKYRHMMARCTERKYLRSPCAITQLRYSKKQSKIILTWWLSITPVYSQATSVNLVLKDLLRRALGMKSTLANVARAREFLFSTNMNESKKNRTQILLLSNMYFVCLKQSYFRYVNLGRMLLFVTSHGLKKCFVHVTSLWWWSTLVKTNFALSVEPGAITR